MYDNFEAIANLPSLSTHPGRRHDRPRVSSRRWWPPPTRTSETVLRRDRGRPASDPTLMGMFPANEFGLVDMIGYAWELDDDAVLRAPPAGRGDGIMLWPSTGPDNQPDPEGRLASVCAGVLPSVSPGRALTAVTGQRDHAHRLPLRIRGLLTAATWFVHERRVSADRHARSLKGRCRRAAAGQLRRLRHRRRVSDRRPPQCGPLGPQRAVECWVEAR